MREATILLAMMAVAVGLQAREKPGVRGGQGHTYEQASWEAGLAPASRRAAL